MYARAGTGLNQEKGGASNIPNLKKDSPLGNQNNVYSEIADIFPALQKYKDEHTSANLQKLMVEILEFCRSVYASTQNEAERQIYHSMIEKLNK